MALYQKSLKLSIYDFRQFGTASITTRTVSDITTIQFALTSFIQMVLPVPVIFIVALALAFSLDMEMGFILLAVVAGKRRRRGRGVAVGRYLQRLMALPNLCACCSCRPRPWAAERWMAVRTDGAAHRGRSRRAGR